MDEKRVLVNLIESKGYTIRSFAEYIDLPYTTLRSMLNSGIGKSSVDNVIKLASGLGLSTDMLIRITGPNGPQFVDDKDTVPIPLIGRICAGEPLMMEDQLPMRYIEVPRSEVSDGNYFYLQVTGDSMTGARIYPGDRVLVREQPDVESGQIAVVIVEGSDATLKRVTKKNGQVILVAENPNYPIRVINSEEARVLGVVKKVEFDPR